MLVRTLSNREQANMTKTSTKADNKTTTATTNVTGNPNYQFAHKHKYDDGKILAPIAVLRVDDENPLPENAQLNFVQIVELAEIGLQLVGNVIIKLTNLLNVGAVQTASLEKIQRPALVEALTELKENESRLIDLASLARASIITVAEDVEESAVDKIKDKFENIGDKLEGLFGLTNKQQAAPTAEQKQNHQSLASTILKGILGDIFKFLARKAIQAILTEAGLYGPANNLRDYPDQFQTIVVPNILSVWQNDDAFAALQTSGPNPLVIERIQDSIPSKFPLNEQDFQKVMGEDDTIAKAISENRLYMVDYEVLAVQIPGTNPQQKYISPAMGLFAIKAGDTSGTLKAVAIQLDQQPSNSNPIFYPHSGDSWQLAKTHFQAANGNYHELISHLGLTHLLIEPLAVSAYRMFTQEHPLMTLLAPHFQGTFFINNAAITSLIAPGGTVDKLLGGTIETDWKVTTTALSELNFDQRMLPNQLKDRGVADVTLPLSYPYRDDALDVWQTISQWCSDYVDIYYTNDEAVSADKQLQNWVKEATSPSGGTIKGLGQNQNGQLGIYTKQYLVKVLTMVIFTASAQHAAVNFPQSTIMSFTPAMPLAAYAPPPVSNQNQPSQSLLQTLPPLNQSLLQQAVGQGLGGVYFTRLGDYNRHQQGHYFSSTRVQSALEVFRTNLEKVESRIGQRNLRRSTYQPLLPSRIPQSINI